MADHSLFCDVLRASHRLKGFTRKTQLSAFRWWFAHFDLAVSHADFQARLWMHGWTIQHTAIVKRKSRSVIWTNNTVPDQFAFRKRPTEMRAGLCHREDSLSPTDKQNGHTVVDCTRWLVVVQFRFNENGHKVFRKYFTSCAINAYSVLVHHLYKDDGLYDFGLRVAIGFCLGGIIVLLHFLTQRGDSDHGFLTAMCLGFAAQGLYAHYRTRKLTMENRSPTP